MNFVIMTKSSKNGKYCVAGIDVSTGNWVRLTTDDATSDGAVSNEDLRCVNGGIAEVLDEIEIDVEPEPDPIQPENMKINGLPRFIQKYDLNMVLRIHPAERDDYVFFSSKRAVQPGLVINNPKSLMLIKVTNLVVEKINDKEAASFDYAANSYTNIRVTDPEIYPIVNKVEVIKRNHAFLVVSLGKPWKPVNDAADVPGLCYKFVAKIFGMKLFTIGHSTLGLGKFGSLLSKYKINYVLDVRSTPYSKYAENYNRENLAYSLQRYKIHYSYMGKYFGARREDKTLYTEEGYLDFEKVRKSSLFLKGFDNVKIGLSQGYNIALMCTEKDPIDCHRAIMVAREFALAGYDIKHILSDGTLMDQEELDRKLLDMYFPDRNQVNIFDFEKPQDNEELLKEAYRKRNEVIGYHLKLEEEGY